MAAEPTPYSEKLREVLDRDGWSQLQLVRELASRTGNGVESERSAVRGYLKGSVPRPARAKLIAEITGVPELARVEDPRRSASARLEDHLEELRENDDAILENQKAALVTQGAMLVELQAIREALDTLLAASRTQPKRKAAR